MSDLDRAAADVQRRGHDVIDAEPVEREDESDDVDDGIDGSDFVKMDFVDRHLMNRRLRFGRAAETCESPAPCRVSDSAEWPMQVRDLSQGLSGARRLHGRGTCG